MQAGVSRQSAELAAQRAFPQAGGVRETVLAIVESPNRPIVNGKLCWVVSLALNGMTFASSGPPGRSGAVGRPSYLLVFIDAQSGQFLFATMG